MMYCNYHSLLGCVDAAGGFGYALAVMACADAVRCVCGGGCPEGPELAAVVAWWKSEEAELHRPVPPVVLPQ